MSPIPHESELGRLIAIKKELGNLLIRISAITNMSNTNNANIKLKVKLVIANIKRVKALRTSYLQSFNNDLNSINSIITSGETIKNININRQRLDSLISNLDNLSLQTTTAIVQIANLVSILDLNERRELGLTSNSRSRPVPRLLIPPLVPYSVPAPYSASAPYSAPPRLQRQPNIGTRPTSLVRQPAMHLQLEDLDLTPSRASSSTSSRNAFGKKYFRARKITRRKRGAKKMK
uniref:Uncharacterized protein n=1 Tax=viral metagenome TaxID=1070528 RepID=A0A6C0D556_9ZZZZ